MKYQLYALLLGLLVMRAYADDHAVALIYHHVSNDTPAATSVSPSVWTEHLEFLAEHEFNIWPLGRILDALAKGEAVPANTVAITFDDAYRSVYTQAYPQLKSRDWPFTLFVNSEAIDRGYQPHMNWQQLRELVRTGVEIGNHSHSHDHLVRRRTGESAAQWRTRVRDDILRAQQRITEELGVTPTLFAYPYGEYSAALQEIVAELGLRGIGQHSGAVGVDSDWLAVPRFPMASSHADMKRFAISISTRPLPVDSILAEPEEPLGAALKRLEITLKPGDYHWSRLACYTASGRLLTLERQSQPQLKLVLPVRGIGQPGRNKVNCTAPAKQPGVYYWYTYQWLQRQDDGSWYRE